MIYRGGASCRRETASYPGWLWRCEQRLQSRCLGSELEQRAFECERELRLGPGKQYPHYSDNDMVVSWEMATRRYNNTNHRSRKFCFRVPPKGKPTPMAAALPTNVVK